MSMASTAMLLAAMDFLKFPKVNPGLHTMRCLVSCVEPISAKNLRVWQAGDGHQEDQALDQHGRRGSSEQDAASACGDVASVVSDKEFKLQRAVDIGLSQGQGVIPRPGTSDRSLRWLKEALIRQGVTPLQHTIEAVDDWEVSALPHPWGWKIWLIAGIQHRQQGNMVERPKS